MRIFAVAQILDFAVVEIEALREGNPPAVKRSRGEVIADRTIVGCGMRKSFLCKTVAGFKADRAIGRLHFSDQLAVIRGIGQHRHVPKILGCGAHQGRPPDVYVFYRFVQGAAGLGDSFAEGVEVHHYHVNHRNAGFA